MTGDGTRMPPIFNKVVIVGVGLIGGSIGLGLRGRFLAREVVGLDRDPEALTTALGLGVIDTAHVEAGAWLRDADLVVLATPVRSLPAVARAVVPYAGADTVFTDVGSVKAPVLAALEGVPGLTGRLVGGHPMAGSERAGVQNAHAGLLENAVWVLTPGSTTGPGALQRVRTLVEQLGAAPVTLDPEAHDRLVATISHLPYLSALSLARLVGRHEERDGLALLAAGGFRDLTRVASGDPRMSVDMVVENRAALRDAVRRYRDELAVVERLLDDPAELLEAASEGKRARDSLPVVRRSLLPALHDLMVAVPDRPGELARITSLLGDGGVNIKDIEVLAIRDQGGSIRVGFAEGDEVARARTILEGAGYSVRGRQ
ncbi:MAG TPA: prephenate dehydrogenase/arogenate dehydrogenase family protein [Deinococcales bacterium]|nr:prephenate dehydrogenase/arogenate dehydrogenase family protein [Deinococcales bacterium]